jgi:hypothetical protein
VSAELDTSLRLLYILIWENYRSSLRSPTSVEVVGDGQTPFVYAASSELGAAWCLVLLHLHCVQHTALSAVYICTYSSSSRARYGRRRKRSRGSNHFLGGGGGGIGWPCPRLNFVKGKFKIREYVPSQRWLNCPEIRSVPRDIPPTLAANSAPNR